ncbi:hypothetical protein COY17_01500 [Candidatus Saccharibacteria bacterium CG_4_10_14_0_2_um_filter_52_9]|nr:MAG: hypothetical protein COY17_01500 [Candidatus Saccharibacteria bacterium CG_4_10_14_0_2_um_filter_52_9]
MSFYTVQRLEAMPGVIPINAFGGDTRVSGMLLQAGAGVQLEYMGSSNFEFDEPLKAANRVARVAHDLKVVTQTLVRPGYSEDVHFVCTEEQAETTVSGWHDWWAFGEDLIWTRKQEAAENIRSAFDSILTSAEAQTAPA